MAKCVACHGILGPSEASFTSECSHVFHPHCVSGHITCPSCSVPWYNSPTFTPVGYSSYSPLLPRPARVPQPFHLSLSLSACAVCQVAVLGGARFTAECRHTFHLTYVFGRSCPACTARWVYHVSSHVKVACTTTTSRWSLRLEEWDLVQDVADGGGKLVLDMHCEHAALARGKSHDNFVVLVHAKAPGAMEAAATAEADEPRALLDLVTVLDVSGSMTGGKIALLKKAMEFVINQLGPADRLSIVAFSTDARRVMPLRRMSDAGKVTAKGAVQLLQANGGTNILKGLIEAAKVLGGRRHKNAVASVILLSDGQDTYNLGNSGYPYNSVSQAKNYCALVPLPW